MSREEPSGADLARVALAAAKEAAKQRGTTTSAKRTPTYRPLARRGGRDPMGLGGALAQLVTERGWETPKAGGSVMDQWPTIATPEVADHLRAVAFDQHTGRLDLLPDTNVWATQARLTSAQIIRQANAFVGIEAVRQIRVLPVGSRTAVPTGPAPALSPEPSGELRTRENASPGYHRTRALIATEPAALPQGPARTREDGCDGYQQTRALVKSPPAPPADPPTPTRTRDDGCVGYREALTQIGAPTSTPVENEEPVRTRETASTGYQLTRRALLEGRSRRPTNPARPPHANESSTP
ncbi:DciA family protein [Streptomyces sp. NPDC088768]|uniref:DciA family protein n=1 Tax=Streptomyces sp. NPDC088768 TaxID=3365894 RepID=UPI003830ABB0